MPLTGSVEPVTHFEYNGAVSRVHRLREGICFDILLFWIKELVGEGALSVFLNHNWMVSYCYLYQYKIQQHEMKSKSGQ